MHPRAMQNMPPETHVFEINPCHNAGQMQEIFGIKRRLHIAEFLDPTSAEALYHHLDEEVGWSTFLTSNGRRYEAPPAIRRQHTSAQERELIDLAHASARRGGLAYVYDASGPLRRDPTMRGRDDSLLARFADFLNSSMFLTFVRRACGVEELACAAVQAVCLRPGHFVSFQEVPHGDGHQGKCCGVYAYNVTPEWKAEWGGLLELRGSEGHLVEAFAPCFNCLDVFACPQGHWVSAVAPFAGGPQYAVSGGLYVR